MLNNLLVPLFLLAEVKYEGKDYLEVIDGLQRLDAIFSFIEQKYKLRDGYFDLDVMVESLDKKNKGILIQKLPKLSVEKSKAIAKYLLPISKSSKMADNEIEETFKRINSNGRHLSRQELRQAGATGQFPILVRKISSSKRGDYSVDNLTLNNMSKISLTNKRLEFYGIDINNIFWIKNNIISFENIRESRDEELIGNILASMILIDKKNYTATNLDSYYGFDPNPLASLPKEKGEIESAIERIGTDIIIKQFDAVYGLLAEVLKNETLTSLLYRNKQTRDNARVYHVLFISIYKLLVKKNLKVKSFVSLQNALRGIGDTYLNHRIIDDLYSASEFEKSTNAIVGIIQKCFIEKTTEDPALDDWTEQISKILLQSKTEQNLYDFKIGVYDFDSCKLNTKLLTKIVTTLSVINNIGPNKVGYIIIGIADDEKAAELFEERFEEKAYVFSDFHITGVDTEARKNCSNIDEYIYTIREHIKKVNVQPSSYINHILTNMITKQFYGKELIIFKTKFDEPVWVEGKMYERQGSSNTELKPDMYQQLYSRFNKSN